MGTLLAYLQLVPVVLGIVKTVEDLIPIPKSGKAKLDLVLGIISDVYDTEKAIGKQLTKDKVIAMANGLIDRTVAALNALGIFKTSQAASPQPAA